MNEGELILIEEILLSKKEQEEIVMKIKKIYWKLNFIIKKKVMVFLPLPLIYIIYTNS